MTTGSWANHGDIWGSGNLTVTSNSNYGKLVVDGDISHTGDTTVDNKSAGVTLELGSTSTYTFTPAANGTNNQINGLDATNSKLNANGTFIIDTASADITDGNAWTLVDVATLTETFSGTFAVQGYTEAANVWTLVDGNNTWTFTEATGVLGLAAAASAYDSWASTMGLSVGVNDGTADNPDGDYLNNLAEFALDGDPLTAIHIHKIAYQLATLGAEDAITITTPVRNGAVFSGASEQVSADIDGVIYRVRGSADLASWALLVSEVTGGDATTIQSGLPTLSSGWTYRTFRLADDIDNLTKGFLRLRVEQP